MDSVITAPVPISDIHLAVFWVTILMVTIINGLTIVSFGDPQDPKFHPAVMFCYHHKFQSLVFGIGTLFAIHAEWYLVVMPTMLGAILSILRDNYIDGIVINSEIEF